MLSRYFFFVLSFQTFDYAGPWISLGLSYLRSSQILQSVGLCCLPNLGSFPLLFLLILLQAYSVTPLLWDSKDENVRSFMIAPLVPGPLLFFVNQYIFSLFISQGNFYCSVFMLLFFPLLSILILSHPLSFLFPLLYFSVLNFPFGSSDFLFICKGFYFSFVLSICELLTETFS